VLEHLSFQNVMCPGRFSNAESGMKITVRQVSPEDFGAMREEWTALLASAANPGPMLTWEWMYSWWEAYRSADTPRQLKLLAARSMDGSLLGLAPLVARDWRVAGIVTRRWEFIGTGERESDETCSEFLDFVVAQGAEEVAAAAWAQWLLATGGWDEIVLRDVRSDHPTAVRRLAAALRAQDARLQIEEFSHARCPYIALPASWDDYLARLSRNSRRLLRYKRRQLLAQHDVEYRSFETPEDVARLMGEFAELHQRRWRADGRSGCFASEVFNDFMLRLTPRLAACGGVRIACLTIDGEPASAYYLLKFRDRLYYYNSGMAVDKFGAYSPGSVCQGYILEEAIQQGLREYHFFKGGGGSYKYHWTETAVPVFSLRIQRKSWKRCAQSLTERLCWGGVGAWRRLVRHASRGRGRRAASESSAVCRED